jgi:hypothetical protein
MNRRIRFALHLGTSEKLSGEVEADETFIGGRARNMHRDIRARFALRRDWLTELSYLRKYHF